MKRGRKQAAREEAEASAAKELETFTETITPNDTATPKQTTIPNEPTTSNETTTSNGMTITNGMTTPCDITMPNALASPNDMSAQSKPVATDVIADGDNSTPENDQTNEAEVVDVKLEDLRDKGIFRFVEGKVDDGLWFE